MSRFSTQSSLRTSKSVAKQQVANLAGGVGYALSPRSKLLTLMVTSFLTDQFYRTASQQLTELQQLIAQLVQSGDGKFVAQTAVLARHEFGTRSITHAAAGEIARLVKGESWTKKFFQKVVKRPDDILEILGYYMAHYPKAPIPNSLRRGLGAKLTELKDYELAKYAKANASLSMVDVVNLLHPKSSVALSKLMNGKLAPAHTWEVGMTQAGQKAKDEDDLSNLKAEVWAGLIKERKLGYFALLRNLRNISQQAPQALDAALEMLVDPALIKKSMVYPFRFVTAWDNIPAGPGSNKITQALSRALDIALDNVPKLVRSGLVALDVSGSMRAHHRIASLFAAALVKKNGFDLLGFDSRARWAKVNTDAPLMAIAESISFPGGATNFEAILDLAQGNTYKHVVIISDMQGWDNDGHFRERFQVWRKPYTCLYSLDMTGSGSVKVPEAQTFLLAGFNEKVFDVMGALEGDPKAFESKALAVEL